TKAVIINSPSNPTGMMYNKEELTELGKVCLKHDIFIVSDEIYEKLIYTDDEHISIAQLSPQLKEQTIVINGVSKSHSMTVWRIGDDTGPEKIIQAMTIHVSHATSNPTSVAQYAALAAYEAESDATTEMQNVCSERLDTVYELLIDIPGISCRKPSGAFYVFPTVKEAVAMNGFEPADDWARPFRDEEQVAIRAGCGFRPANNVRRS